MQGTVNSPRFLAAIQIFQEKETAQEKGTIFFCFMGRMEDLVGCSCVGLEVRKYMYIPIIRNNSSESRGSILEVPRDYTI